MSTTPNMNLTLPVVSQTPGPSWANQINTDLTVIDAHNHIPSINGGVAITTAALNIDADLSFNTYSALSLSSAEFVNQAATPSASRVYITGGDLWYSYDGVTPVQITSGSAIVGAPGNIVGMGGTNNAAVIYSNSTETFTFFSDQAVPAMRGILDVRNVTFRATAAAAPVTVSSSASASTYTLTLPLAVPGSQGVVGFASSGALSPVTPDSTITVSSSTISVAALGITSAQLANPSVTTAKITDQAVTQAKMEAKSPSSVAVATFSQSGSGTQIVGSFTSQFVAGRPVLITLEGLQQTGNAPVSVPSPTLINCTGAPQMYVTVTHPNGTTQTQMCNMVLASGVNNLPAVQGLFSVTTTGQHTVALVSYISTGGWSTSISNLVVKAFQL